MKEKNPQHPPVEHPQYVMTLLQAFESVSTLSEDSKLAPGFFRKAQIPIAVICSRYGIFPRQAVLLAACVELGPRHIEYSDLCQHFSITKFKAYAFAPDIDALEELGLLYYDDDDKDSFSLPSDFINLMSRDEVYEKRKYVNLCIDEMLVVFDGLFGNTIGTINAEKVVNTVSEILADNLHLAFSRKICFFNLDRTEQAILCYFCVRLVIYDDDDIRTSELSRIYKSDAAFARAKFSWRNGTTASFVLGLIEHICNDGIKDTDHFHLTDEAKADLLGEFALGTADAADSALLRPDSLVEKKLFYSSEVERQVDDLRSLLQPEKFAEIQRRMSERGFRNGFACLFYGAPGTGKTETAMQLARQSGRAIFFVEMANIKSKWVGDSEKNIKAVFTHYRDILQREKLAPILLFNEADAIFGKRLENVEHSVDKMENAIQNIILQEMENFEGILIATTNIQQNFDKAFERRFLYKIKFDLPSPSSRAMIWKEMIPDLDDVGATALAGKYNFSGGQIENIARLHTIDIILRGTDGDILARLMRHCEKEVIDNDNRKKIGFS